MPLRCSRRDLARVDQLTSADTGYVCGSTPDDTADMLLFRALARR